MKRINWRGIPAAAVFAISLPLFFASLGLMLTAQWVAGIKKKKYGVAMFLENMADAIDS